MSTKGSASSGAARSIPWERISSTDFQADVFSYASMEPTLQRLQADEIADDESDGDGEQFRTALDAVVTEVKPDYVEASSRMAISSPKKDQQPFKFPRPAPTKPPAGIQNKQTTGQAKPKTKPTPPKKAPPAKKKGGKKPAKQAKPSKPAKATKGKTGAPKREEQPEKVEEVKEAVVEEVQEETTDVARVDSETGERELEILDSTVVSSNVSRDTSARISSKASDEVTEIKSVEPHESPVSSVPEIPRIVPKPPEPQSVPEVASEAEPRVEQPSPAQEQKQPQESRAARRAAERAAAAERRRQEVERKRREREEAKRRALEEEARLEQLRLEAEEDMKRREEERRLEYCLEK